MEFFDNSFYVVDFIDKVRLDEPIRVTWDAYNGLYFFNPRKSRGAYVKRVPNSAWAEVNMSGDKQRVSLDVFPFDAFRAWLLGEDYDSLQNP